MIGLKCRWKEVLSFDKLKSSRWSNDLCVEATRVLENIKNLAILSYSLRELLLVQS